MRGDKKSTEGIGPGSILQIKPDAQLGYGDGMLGVVVAKESWGCKLALPNGAFSIAWDHLGNTGGAIVWDAEGKLMRPQEEPLRHHL